MGNSNSRESERRNTVGFAVAAGILVAVTGGAALGVVAGVAAHTIANQGTQERSSSNSPAMSSSGGSSTSMTKANSPIWQDLSYYRGDIRTNGRSGSSRCYFTWDYTHNHIEKYNHIGKHMGAIHPVSGELCKSAVPGRSIRL